MIGNNNLIDSFLREQGVSLVGFADLAEVDPAERENLRFGVCFAIALKVFPGMEEPTADYYNEYKAINRRLREISYLLEERIIGEGYKAYSLARNRQDEQYRTKLPFKTLATRAGIGWIGKSSTLITREYGSAIRLNGVVTDMPFVTGTPVNESTCGACRACVDACPGKAIAGLNWSPDRTRDELVNPYVCKQTVIKRGEAMGVTEGSCGICLAACPWTQRYMKRLREA